MKSIINKTSNYIYYTEDKEAERLKRLNEVYNPNTQQLLIPILKPDMKVLEIGAGVGILGCWIAKKIGPNGQYYGLEQLSEQIEKATQLTKSYSLHNTHYIQGKVEEITANSSLANEKFDLIFCRWVIAHLPPKIVASVLQTLYSFLNPNGNLVCEEGDVTQAHCIDIHQQIIHPPAFQQWYDVVFKLEKEFDLDFSLGKNLLNIIMKSLPVNKAEIYRFQPVLSNKHSKEIVSLAIPSMKNAILKAKLLTENEVDQLEADLIELAEMSNIQVKFVENYAVLVKNSL